MANFYTPLAPTSQIDQGDPFVLTAPPTASYRYYIYTTGANPPDGTAIPCYGTHDFTTVDFLGWCLVNALAASHWAPCVQYLPGLQRPYVMLYSRAIGLGEQGHVGHHIRRADSVTPEGPFEDSGHVLSPPEHDFAIDPDVYQLPNGQRMMGWATDFVHDVPLGTGIVEAPINSDLTQLLAAPTVLARAVSDQQLYEENRYMPWKTIPGIDWSRGDRAPKWYTVEAPVGLVSPQGRRVVLYSTGNFSLPNYAVGALVETDTGELEDVTNTRGHFVVRSQPESDLYALGHPSALGTSALLIHMRKGVHGPRQMALIPLLWTADSVPYCPLAKDLA